MSSSLPDVFRSGKVLERPEATGDAWTLSVCSLIDPLLPLHLPSCTLEALLFRFFCFLQGRTAPLSLQDHEKSIWFYLISEQTHVSTLTGTLSRAWIGHYVIASTISDSTGVKVQCEGRIPLTQQSEESGKSKLLSTTAATRAKLCNGRRVDIDNKHCGR